MFDKLSKDEFRYFLVNAKREISFILDMLDDEDAIDILTYLHYEPATYPKLKNFFDKLDSENLSYYVTNLMDYGIAELNRKHEYQITKLGNKFLQITIQFVLEAILTGEIEDEKLKDIVVQKIGEDELVKKQKAKLERKTKGIQIRFHRGP